MRRLAYGRTSKKGLLSSNLLLLEYMPAVPCVEWAEKTEVSTPEFAMTIHLAVVHGFRDNIVQSIKALRREGYQS